MPEIIPRYEFRIFADNLVPVFQTIKEMAGEPYIRESEEIYIVSEFCWDTNLKIRDDKLDIKVLIREKEELEQWVPRMKLDFPIDQDLIRDVILEDLLFDDFNKVELPQKPCSEDEFIGLTKRIHGIKAVTVKKKRYGFLIKDVMLEFAELLINGKTLHTVAVESVETEEVKKLLKELDIANRENVNYPLAIRRMVGLEPEEAGENC
jgi:hypothetical protein